MTPDPESEQIARDFHETYERLAPEHGYETRPDSAKPWEDVPDQNKGLMCAVIDELLTRGVISPGPQTAGTTFKADKGCVTFIVNVVEVEQIQEAIECKDYVEAAVVTVLDNGDIEYGHVEVAAAGVSVE